MHLKFSAFLSLILLSAFSFGQNSTFNKVDVESSIFVIKGSTNVNRFECEMNQAYENEQLVVRSSREDRIISFDGLKLCYPVSGFQCAIKAMSKDLQQTLKSDEFPCLFMEINKIIIAEENDAIENLKVKSEVTITIAGTTVTMIIEDGQVVNHSENSLTLFGNKVLKMTDFGIEPPTKFLGLVQVTNDLDVTFEIKLIVQPAK
ncbi:MAG: hypothetical protein ABJP45_08550 [Cyclobacteriaceae bacterium]